MVEMQSNLGVQQLVLCPNRSMSWQTNKRILAVMFCVNMAIGITWAVMGAWMVLPFAGLEIALVGLGMYYVSWKLSFKEIIIVEAESLILQKGVYFPKEEWHWQLANTRLIRQASNYRMSAPTLFLEHLNEKVEIAAFLNTREKKQLREYLKELGLPLISVSAV